MTGYRDLVRNRDFTVLWVGQTVSEVGSRMSMFVFPLLGYQLTGSTVVAALAEAVYLVGMAGALLPAGVLADRLHRLRLMRLASGSGVLLYASLAAALVTGHLTIPHLLVVGLATGAGAGVFAPAEMSAIRAVVPAEQLPTALSQNQARQHVASLLGGPVGGALYGLVRWLPFAVDALSYAVSFVLLGRIRTDLSPAPRAEQHARLRDDLRAGFRFVGRHPFLRVVLAWSPLTNLVINAVLFAAVLRLLKAGFSPAQIGLTDAVAGTCGLLGALAAPTIIDRLPTGWLTVAVAWSWVPLLVPMIVWNHPVAVALSLGAGLLLNPAGNAGVGAYRVAITPLELQGRVVSAMQFASWTTMPVAPLLGGVMLAWLGGPGAVSALTVCAAGVALLVTLSPAVRSVPRPAGWPPAADVPAQATDPVPA